MVLLSKKDIQLSRKRLRGDAFSLFIIPNIGPVQKLDFERVEVGKRQQQKIAKLLGEAKAEEVISGNYSEQEAEYRAAFKLIGKEYIEDLDKRESFLLENPDIYNQFASALPLVESVNDKLLGGQAYKPMQDQFVVVKAEKPGIDKKLLGLGVLGLTLAAGLGAFLYKQHLDEQMRKPYKQAGLSDEQAKEFIANYPNQNGNSTWVSFAKFWAKDKALADESLKTFGNLKDSLEYLYLSDDNQLLIKSLEAYGKDATSFVNFVKSNSYDGLGFLKDLPQLAKNYQEVLPAYSANSTLIKIVYDQFQRDPRVSFDRNELFLRGLKEYQDLNLIKKNLMIQTVQALNNLTLAYQQGLPRLDKNSVWLLTNATQISKDIVDFEPVIIKDVTGNKIVIQSQNLSRDYWMVANLLKERPALASQAEKFEWLNKMIQQVAFDIFDYEYGPKYFDKKSYKPNDPEVWQVILGFNDYMDALPAKLEKDGIPIAFPYWDSSLLKQQIADKANRTIALFYLADLPAKTVNQTYAAELRRLAQERKITDAEYDRLYQEKAVVKGIEGMKLFVQQLPKEYEEIKSLYPNGKVGRWNEDPRGFSKGWLADRFCHGLSYTVGQYVGFDDTTVRYFMNKISDWNEMEFRNKIDKSNGIYQFLIKNWTAGDLVNFIYGYERFAFPGGEWEMYAYGLPLAYKAFGIPLGQMGGFGTSGNLGGPGNYSHGEFAIYGIPQTVIDALRAQKSLGRIAIGYGNGISMMSCIDGFEKDTGYEILHGIRGINIYLWKK